MFQILQWPRLRWPNLHQNHDRSSLSAFFVLVMVVSSGLFLFFSLSSDIKINILFCSFKYDIQIYYIYNLYILKNIYWFLVGRSIFIIDPSFSFHRAKIQFKLMYCYLGMFLVEVFYLPQLDFGKFFWKLSKQIFCQLSIFESTINPLVPMIVTIHIKPDIFKYDQLIKFGI